MFPGRYSPLISLLKRNRNSYTPSPFVERLVNTEKCTYVWSLKTLQSDESTIASCHSHSVPSMVDVYGRYLIKYQLSKQISGLPDKITKQIDWGRLPRKLNRGTTQTRHRPQQCMAYELSFHNHLGCRKDVITSRSSTRYKTKLLVGRSAKFAYVWVR